MLSTVLFALLAASSSGGDLGVRIDAKINAETLQVGTEFTVELALTLPDGVDAAGGGLPAPVLQLDVPASLELLGKHITEYRELASNEFLDQPYERLIEGGKASIRVRLIAEPQKNATLGLNVIGYLSMGAEKPVRFMRRRLELPIEAQAVAREGDARDSSWGISDVLLNIGDEAPDFILPTSEGGEVALSDLAGELRTIVTTYRAFW